MAFLCGLISRVDGRKAEKVGFNIFSAIIGQVAYIILYLLKSYITGILEGSAPEALVPVLITKLTVSSLNAVIGVLIAVLLCIAVKKSLKKSGLESKF
jgi:uncharacterized membrane protein